MTRTSKPKNGLWWKFILATMLVLLAVSAAVSICSALLYRWFHRPFELAETTYGVMLSIILGISVTAFLTNRILLPISKLSRAMSTVAHGDFSIRLESESTINEIQDLYRNFNLMVAELAATETLQTDFVSNVSHEFKTPINAIEGYATLLHGDAQLSPDQAEYTEKILSNTSRLSGLVSNILLLSKLNNQAIPARLERFRLDEQIRYAIVALEAKWEEKQIDIEADLAEVCYEGHESLLLHAWLNLIDNAIKFDPVGGCVTIRLKRSEQAVLVSVQDTGCGISPADQKRIFDKFYQADSSHKDEGNGLGLSLVQQIVSIHHGRIEVENCPNDGCKFTVVLPQ